jgi:putative ABC transport system permease protein
MRLGALARHVFLGSLWRRRLATSLSLLAIALGVALGLAVQLIHAAALDEFGRGMRLISGEADLQVVGPQSGFDDGLYLLLAKRPEVVEASPLLEIEARLPGRTTSLRILGIDLFRAARVTPSLLPLADAARSGEAISDRIAPTARGDVRLDVLQPDALFASPAATTQLALASGAILKVQVGTREVELRLAGSVPAAGVGQVLAVMDIAAAQQTFERIGRLSRIDIRLAPGIDRGRARQTLNALLPPGVSLRTPADAQSEIQSLSRAYRVNLTMLAAIALLTGGFLVFSAQWLAVVRRRQEFAFLRALGLDRAGLRRGLLAEGALLGLVGGLIGVVLAHGLTALSFRLIGGDLGAGYFRGLAPELQWEPGLILGYLALGIGAGLAGAWLPAREAARLIPARALRAGDEAEAYQAPPRWGLTLSLLALAALSCLLPPLNGLPLGGYLAVALILVGAVLALPGVTPWAMRPLAGSRGILMRLARARLAAAPGQAVVAGAGVVASVALAVSMAIMVSSFRGSLDDWLTQMLPADLYLRAAAGGTSGYLEPAWVDRVGQLPGVMAVRPVRFESLRSAEGGEAIALIARPSRIVRACRWWLASPRRTWDPARTRRPGSRRQSPIDWASGSPIPFRCPLAGKFRPFGSPVSGGIMPASRGLSSSNWRPFGG